MPHEPERESIHPRRHCLFLAPHNLKKKDPTIVLDTQQQKRQKQQRQKQETYQGGGFGICIESISGVAERLGRHFCKLSFTKKEKEVETGRRWLEELSNT
jgi:hypothetical protein